MSAAIKKTIGHAYCLLNDHYFTQLSDGADVLTECAVCGVHNRYKTHADAVVATEEHYIQSH